jgi:branched-chain amino acid transport system substrate-binding protein
VCYSFYDTLSGPAAVFGIPMVRAAEMIVEQINEAGGILGEREIQMDRVDENVDDIVQVYRRLATQDDYDVIFGFISSADVLSISPLAEELSQPTLIMDTGTTELFDNAVPDAEYTYRLAASSSIDAVGAARLVHNALPDVETVAGINQDYAYGRNNWDLFQRGLESLGTDVEIVDARFTPFPNDDFSSAIAALNDANPDFIFSSLWGGGLVNFMTQANERDLFDDTLACFSGGTHVFFDAPDQVVDGLIFGPRGPHFPFDILQASDLHQNFVQNYQDRYDGDIPYAHGAWHAWTTMYAYVHAIERAYNISGEYPSDEEWLESLNGIGFDTPSGFASIPRGGNNAVEPAFWGRADTSGENITMTDPVWIAKEEVNPPVDKTTGEWIENF